MAALTVEAATNRILAGVVPLATEVVPVESAVGRTLGLDLAALLTAPPFDASAMDGYAVRAADVLQVPATLVVIGEAAAGHAFAEPVGAGEAVRIFTGAPVPAGADAVVIQENTCAEEPGAIGPDAATAEGHAGRRRIVVVAGSPDRDHIRRRGADFTTGDIRLTAGRRLGAREVTIAAAMGHGQLAVVRRPTVAVLSTGDELVLPGARPGPAEIVACNHLGVMALCEQAGAAATFLGIARDTEASLAARLERADAFDIGITIGGASVGDHDLVAPALARRGAIPDFWKIAMRPGKPLMFGRLGPTHIVGLPGNPVSALICARLFIVPLIRALVGDPTPRPRTEPIACGVDLAANGARAHYMRAVVTRAADGRAEVRPLSQQDSSLLTPFADANALLVRPIDGAPVLRGNPVPVLMLDP